MRLQHKDKDGRGEMHFLSGELQIKEASENPKNQFLTIALNVGENQRITIDGSSYDFPSWSIIPLVSHQIFSFENPETINFWRYNRDFYCMSDKLESQCMVIVHCSLLRALFLQLL